MAHLQLRAFKPFAALRTGLFVCAVALRASGEPDGSGWLDLDQLMNLRVTVTRHETTIDAIPARVEAITGTLLEEQGISSLLEVGRQTTSMEFSRLVNIPYVFSRGAGSDLTSIAVDSSTALHQDGVYLGLPDMTIPFFWDLDRVEILSGPQGSLYGRNADAGVINIINQRPLLKVNRVETLARAGTEGLLGGEVRINRVTDETSALRLALMGRSDNGYIQNLDTRGASDVDDHDARGLRFQWLKGDLETGYFLVAAEHYRDDTGGNTSVPVDAFGAAFPDAIAAGAGETRNNVATYAKIRSTGIRIEGFRPVAEWRLTGILAWRDFGNRYLHNLDGTEVDITNSDSDRSINQVSADLLASTGSVAAKGRITLGANLYSANADYDVALVRAPLGASIVFKSPLKNEAVSAFAEWEHQWNERWTITAGARFSYETKVDSMMRYTIPGLNGLGSSLGGVAPLASTSFKRSWAKLTPRAVLAYRHNDEVHFYASVTNGFKSGGMNSLSSDPPVNPEDAWNFEAGYRFHSSRSAMAASATVFRTEYKNLQVSTFVDSGARVANAASAHVNGFELALQKDVFRRLALSWDTTLLDATYGSYTAAQGNRPFIADGNQMPHAPRWVTKLSTHYQASLGSGTYSFRLTWTARDKTYFNALEDEAVAQGSVSLWDASVTWRQGETLWLRLSGQNLGDVFHYDNIVRFTSSTTPAHPEGNAMGYPAPGRTIVLSTGWAF